MTPITTSVNERSIPEALKVLPCWLNWVPSPNGQKWGKIPKTPLGQPASSTNPETWSDFASVLAASKEAAEKGTEGGAGAGTGFAVTPESGLAGIDLDNCLNPETGEAAPWAKQIIDDMATYTEISPGGAGFRLWLYGAIPDKYLSNDKKGRRKGKIEVYCGGRFLTVTGNHVPDTPSEPQKRHKELALFCGKTFKPVETSAPDEPQDSDSKEAATAEQKAAIKKLPLFDDTWNREREDLEDQSPSSYELALANLAVEAGFSDAGIVWLFRAWRNHHSENLAKLDRQDYIASTIAKARSKKRKTSKTRTTNAELANYELTEAGLYYKEEENKIWISSPLHIEAKTRNEEEQNWGYLLNWTDPDRNPHQWAMPATMLSGGGEEYRAELLDGGFCIAPGSKHRNLLTAYIQLSRPEETALCTDRTGWHGSVFVLPNRTIGQAGQKVVYQSSAANQSHFTTAGTLEEWKEHSRLFCGNTRSVFVVSSMFAGPLLDLLKEESGGVHIAGGSSIGKTTLLKAAQSVWGGKQFMKTWRATSNGLEAIAAAHSGTGLILDEIGQVDGKEAGECSYMLANGEGKQRASRSGGARKKQTWRLLFLSSGETDLSQHMRAAGKKARAGQEIRLLTIEADPGAGLGIFENLHGYKNGAAFSKHISQQAETCYGSAGPAFVEKLAVAIEEEPDSRRIKDLFNKIRIELDDYIPPKPEGQISRAVERFALIATAGELAIEFGITDWQEGEATIAAVACFKSWLSQRGGTGSQEEAEILEHVKLFFAQHGQSRFQALNKDFQDTIYNQAGFIEKEGEENIYIMLPQLFRKELCGDHTPKRVIEVLLDNGILIPGTGGREGNRSTHVKRLPGTGPKPVRCYKLQPFHEDTEA